MSPISVPNYLNEAIRIPDGLGLIGKNAIGFSHLQGMKPASITGW
jgi:hypothetical protein